MSRPKVVRTTRPQKTLTKRSWRRDRDEDPLEYSEWLSIATYHPDQDFAWREHERYGRIHERFRREHEETFDMGGEG